MRAVRKFQKWQDKLVALTVQDLLVRNGVTPNHLTYLRFFIVFVLALIFVLDIKITQHNFVFVFLIFLIGIITDFVDGAIARNTNQITERGEIIDPLADKMLVVVMLLIVWELVDRLLLYWLVGTEVLVGLFVLFYKYVLKQKTDGANDAGKLKMFLESIGICLLFLSTVITDGFLIWVGNFLIWCGLVFAYLSILKALQEKKSEIKAKIKTIRQRRRLKKRLKKYVKRIRRRRRRIKKLKRMLIE